MNHTLYEMRGIKEVEKKARLCDTSLGCAVMSRQRKNIMTMQTTINGDTQTGSPGELPGNTVFSGYSANHEQETRVKNFLRRRRMNNIESSPLRLRLIFETVTPPG